MAWDFQQLVNADPHVEEAVEALGNIGPTANPDHKQVKGYYIDPEEGGGCSVYYSADDLKRIANGAVQIANFLENRALSSKNAG